MSTDYLATFAEVEKAGHSEPAWLRERRQQAMERFLQLGFPTTRDEEWRFTNVAPIARTRFEPAPAADVKAPRIFADQDCVRLVFVNGRLASQPSGVPLVAASLREALHDLGPQTLGAGDQAFAALNTALFQDGAYIRIPRGTVVERPIHVIFVSTANGAPTISHPRNLYVIEPEARATIIESYTGLGGRAYFTNAVTEIAAGEGAVVDHYKFQDELVDSYHIATLAVRQARGSNFTSNSLSFGGALARNDVNATLSEGSECTLNGLYLAGSAQHVDNHTTIDHANPHAASHELYKGILDGRSRAVFNGRIIVRKDAQKTDAKQTNKNLVLSEDATINTKPELQIFADDVRCTHGATVGQLDPEAIFYLRSRGIGEREARRMLTLAFARDVIDRVKVDPLRERLESILLGRLFQEAA
jgi:Fe-S cluster assembly protein SufD